VKGKGSGTRSAYVTKSCGETRTAYDRIVWRCRAERADWRRRATAALRHWTACSTLGVRQRGALRRCVQLADALLDSRRLSSSFQLWRRAAEKTEAEPLGAREEPHYRLHRFHQRARSGGAATPAVDAVTPLRPRRVLARHELSDSGSEASEGSREVLIPAEHGDEEFPSPQGGWRLSAWPVEQAAAPLTLIQEETASRAVRLQRALEAELADWVSEASSPNSAELSLSSVLEDEDAASTTRISVEQASRQQAPAEAAETEHTDSHSSPSPPLHASQRAHRSQLARRMTARLGSVRQ
jgi:hypothetical protein